MGRWCCPTLLLFIAIVTLRWTPRKYKELISLIWTWISNCYYKFKNSFLCVCVCVWDIIELCSFFLTLDDKSYDIQGLPCRCTRGKCGAIEYNKFSVIPVAIAHLRATLFAIKYPLYYQQLFYYNNWEHTNIPYNLCGFFMKYLTLNFCMLLGVDCTFRAFIKDNLALRTHRSRHP